MKQRTQQIAPARCWVVIIAAGMAWLGAAAVSHAQGVRVVPNSRAPRGRATEKATAATGTEIMESTTIVTTNISHTPGKAPVMTFETNTVKKIKTTTSSTDKAADNVAKAATTNEPALVNTFIQFNTGVMLVNPYTVGTNKTDGKTRLTDGKSQGRFFFEVAANYHWASDLYRRWAWATSRQDPANANLGLSHLALGTRSADKSPGEFGIGMPDFSGRLLFLAQDDKKTTAAAIVGSGEFGMETTVGIPFYQAISTYSGKFDATNAVDFYADTYASHWVGIVGSWSGVTDSSAFHIHNRYFVGVGYRAAFKVPWESDTTGQPFSREITMNFQIGKAWVDAVQFTDRADHVVRADALGEPHYSERGAMGVEAEFYIPLGKSLSGVVGARFYPISGNTTPNTWNAYTGLTVPLSKLAALFE